MRFITKDAELLIQLEGSERLWALKSSIVLNREDVIRVRYVDTFADWRKWEIRMPGTGMPGVLIAGSFWTEQGWDFLYLVKPNGWWYPTINNVLVIETNLSRYRRIILSCTTEQAVPVLEWAN